MKRIVSLTPLPVRSDSRTYRIAESFIRQGYRSLVVEGSDSGDLITPFERIALQPGVPVSASADPTRDLRSRLRRIEQFIPGDTLRILCELPLFIFYIANFLWKYGISVASKIPFSSRYYLHSFQYYPVIYLRHVLTGARFVYDAHDCYRRCTPPHERTFFEARFLDWWIEILERSIFRHAEEVVTVSEGVADLLEKMYGRRPRVIRNCHDLRADLPTPVTLRNELGFAATDFVMVVVGNDKAGAANETLLRAMVEIDARLVFLGRGYDRFQPLVQQLGIENRVFLHAPIPNRELVDYIRDADLSVLPYFACTPNYRASLPNKMFESVAAKLPLLYPDLPQIRQTVSNFGRLFDPRSPESFRNAVNELRANPDELAGYRRHLEHSELDWTHEENLLSGLFSAPRRADILVIYFQESPLRSTVRDHLLSFRHFSGHRVYYHNARLGIIPLYLQAVEFDLIVFHTSVLSRRWDRPAFSRWLAAASVFAHIPAVKIALPQDEFINLDLLNAFLNAVQIDHVFSVAPASEWPKIYRELPASVQFHEVLTGYLDDALVEWARQLNAPLTGRPIDIGYRARKIEAWQGRFGLLKAQIADVFLDQAKSLKLDISTDPADTIMGDDWYRFLASCKYTIGVEGGAGIIDWDGSLRERTNRYAAKHPEASFEEIEATCFPGMDNSLALHALSPRHLEACLTRTCQILIEGQYNGILQPGVHYLELKRDFSNLPDILHRVQDDTERATLTANAWRDVVESGHYTYRGFVAKVLEPSLPQTMIAPRHPVAQGIGYLFSLALDGLSRALVAGYHRINVKLGLYPHDSLFHYLFSRKVR